jgi:WD40 repeat protein
MDRLSKAILSMDISRDSTLVAAAMSDLHVRIWKLELGDLVHEFSFEEPKTDQRLKLDNETEPMCVRFSPDMHTFAVSFLSKIYIYDSQSWGTKTELGFPGENDLWPDVERALNSPALKTRTPEEAAAERSKPDRSFNDKLQQWLAVRRRGDGRTRIMDFRFTRDGKAILVAYCRGTCYASAGLRWAPLSSGRDPVRLWDLGSGQILWEQDYGANGTLVSLVPSPDESHFAGVRNAFGRCAIGIYSLADGAPIAQFSPSSMCEPPLNVSFLPDGKKFIANRSEIGDLKKHTWMLLALYDASSGQVLSDFSGKIAARNATTTADGRWLATTTWKGLRFRIWDLVQNRAVLMETPKEWLWRGPTIDRVVFSPDGNWLIAGNDETGSLATFRFSH